MDNNVIEESLNNNEETEKEEKKAENKKQREIIFQEISHISNKVDIIEKTCMEFQNSLEKFNRLSLNKDAYIADKDEELKRYKKIYDLQKRVIQQIIFIREAAIKRSAVIKNSEESESSHQIIEIIEDTIEDYKILLEYLECTVISNRDNVQENVKFDSSFQKVIKTIPTEDINLHRVVKSIVSDYYIFNSEIIARENVIVYKHDNKKEED